MRKILTITLFSALILLSSCDPIYIMFVKNETGEKVKVHVDYENRYEIEFDSLKYTIEQIDNLKPRHVDSLTNKKAINLTETNYSFEIADNETVVLEPLSIGVPIQRVIYETKSRTDTIFEFGDRIKYQELVDKGIIVKKGLSTRIVYLKQID